MNNCTIIFIIAIIIVITFYMFSRYDEKFSNTNLTAPIDVTPIMKTKSDWDFYGNFDNYFMDKLTKKGNPRAVKYPPHYFYCDRPNRNRAFLVNPVLTQKHIFIKPNIDAFKYPSGLPDWGNSAQEIRIGSEVESNPLQEATKEDIFYSNFSDVVKKYYKGELPKQAYMDSYDYRCADTDIPENTFTNPY